ncbi:hypothetical protein SAMN06265374_1770 [Roseibium denhamense]|uniref:Uncharacterized protein n=1 Tax=Roseibium denhamense TaxID=76305 RepID=A0ABY1NTC4_9HYPH|nr:hypothetical protein SAMN06265374_1770 [Roseibium denhamense]
MDLLSRARKPGDTLQRAFLAHNAFVDQAAKELKTNELG